MSWQCFWIEPTDLRRRFLRRFTFTEKKCPVYKYGHEASIPLDDGVKHLNEGIRDLSGDIHPHDDPLWPKVCKHCWYIFQPEDQWQLQTEHIYKRTDTGAWGTLRDVPVGAMWNAEWMPWKGPDGRSLVVRCPNFQDWLIDHEASGGGHWERTGEPPNITVTPSISIGIDPNRYHGFLTAGVLTDDVEGKSWPA